MKVTDTTNLLTRAEAAQLLGVSAQTLAVWACTGRYHLPYIKVGRLPRYRRVDIENWLVGRRVGDAGVAE